MKVEELKVIADLTKDLVSLRQKGCEHLCIENFAPQIFGDLLNAYFRAGTVIARQDLSGFPEKYSQP